MTNQYLDGDHSWYAVCTNPKQEDRANDNLMAWNVETFAPKIKQRRLNPYTGDQTYLVKPLFPRYIFARFDITHMLHKVRFTRGVYTVVSFGHGPSPVDERIISLIRSRTDDEGFVKLTDEFKPGDQVRITVGPFKDLFGIFEKDMKDNARVMVLLNFINYQAHVNIRSDYLQKVG